MSKEEFDLERRKLTLYILGSAMVWAAIILGAASILKGTPYLAQLLPILGGGAVWSVVIGPAALLRRRQK
ncbi:MAG: hypothetical protein ACE5H2_07255 [Terriglobia bacterium]